jgi:hypothetical protein
VAVTRPGRHDLCAEHVAAVAHGLDVARLPHLVVQALADPAHKQVDRSVEHVRIAALRQVEQLVPREDPLRMVEEDPQQAVFRPRQRDHRTLLVDQVARDRVQPPGAEPQFAGRLGGRHVRREHPRSPQHGADTRQQFARRERFGQVIVRTQLEAEDAIGLVGACRQHHDGQVRTAGAAQFTAEGDAVGVRQHQVQHHQVDLVRRDRGPHLGGARRRRRAQSLLLQVLGDELADPGIVIDEKNVVGRGVHGRIVTARCALLHLPGLYPKLSGSGADMQRDERARHRHIGDTSRHSNADLPHQRETP